MKTLIAVVMLLALVSPAHAAKVKPQDFPDIRKWQELNWQCHDDVSSDDDLDVEITKKDYDKTRRGRICLAAEALGKKLVAAGLLATPAQWKDIRAMSDAFLRCDNSEEDYIKKACALSGKLQDKLAKQGFCTYGRILVGRPGKDGKGCDLLHNYPMHVLIP